MDTTVSVVIPAHSERRWDALVAAVESVQGQSSPPVELILAIDHNQRLQDRAAAAFPRVRVVANRDQRGASATRNAGVAAASGAIIAFLDDDAVADPHWLATLCAPLDDPAVLGTGGGVRPIWPGPAPRWFPAEFGWVVGASYRGMPEVPGPVRNVWGLNMALRRDRFLAVGGFRGGFGKLGERSRPEDTEFCLRVRHAHPDGHWLHVPRAMVGHQVPADRATMRFFLRRCWHEGRGKAELAALLGSGDATSSERAYVLRTLPRGAGRELRGALTGDLAGLARSTSILTGVTATSVGMLAGQFTAARMRGARGHRGDRQRIPAPRRPETPADTGRATATLPTGTILPTGTTTDDHTEAPR
ncbi:glycosyltransferase [Frankia sp. AgPm24]|uniref:glycosyltransferase family 2 protein n=1 Tax=Frankia sp. AgPm24 TaxID=631128 RepID=UPI0020100926|nr:glycosyltransferase family 2 protein [Frankia sp. AgPm24]MCK9925030.1 glycosyltransferase [Frankia sp. AgPm24]